MSITDTALLNRQIFSKSNIQVSPHHMVQLNMQPPKLFKSKLIKITQTSGYKVFLTGYAEYVIKNEFNVYASYTLENQINQLRANPRSVKNSFLMKNSVDTRKMSTGKYDLWYKIVSGQIVVFNVELKDEFQKARDRLEKPGLYKIKKTTQGNWVKDNKVEGINTSYAAVNGMLNN
ncbi:MAG: hypothetical protein OQK95_13560, partial [Gammaproteobacteria bacterium]|nr:hypothetical protein [Gammaproteobacteria bacterium]